MANSSYGKFDIMSGIPGSWFEAFWVLLAVTGSMASDGCCPRSEWVRGNTEI